jgi:hypothetical protein
MDFFIELIGEFVRGIFGEKGLWIIAAIAVLVAAFLLLPH